MILEKIIYFILYMVEAVYCHRGGQRGLKDDFSLYFARQRHEDSGWYERGSPTMTLADLEKV